jgi:hypothetical protein
LGSIRAGEDGEAELRELRKQVTFALLFRGGRFGQGGGDGGLAVHVAGEGVSEMNAAEKKNCGDTPQPRSAPGHTGNELGQDVPATFWSGREEFKARVLEWARKLEVDAKSIYIRPMQRKWASCSTAGTLSFNDELLEMPEELGDYVIVHELLHFVVPNHGKLWKSLMRAHLGEYERIEAELRNWATGS